MISLKKTKDTEPNADKNITEKGELFLKETAVRL